MKRLVALLLALALLFTLFGCAVEPKEKDAVDKFLEQKKERCSYCRSDALYLCSGQFQMILPCTFTSYKLVNTFEIAQFQKKNVKGKKELCISIFFASTVKFGLVSRCGSTCDNLLST